jgi:hypothetical protein
VRLRGFLRQNAEDGFCFGLSFVGLDLAGLLDEGARLGGVVASNP